MGPKSEIANVHPEEGAGAFGARFGSGSQGFVTKLASVFDRRESTAVRTGENCRQAKIDENLKSEPIPMVTVISFE